MQNKIINIETYEIFWIDYLDGKLSIEEEDLLFEFLEKHPDIASDLIDTDGYRVPNLNYTFPNKENLLMENQIDNLLIAKIENVINEEDDSFISQQIEHNPEIEKTYDQYKKTILNPDKSIIYPGKHNLYRAEKKTLYRFTPYLVAASVVLIVAAGFLFMKNNIGNFNNSQDPNMAKNNVTIIDSEKNNIQEINKDTSDNNNLYINENKHNQKHNIEEKNYFPEKQNPSNQVIEQPIREEYESNILTSIPEKIPVREIENLAFENDIKSVTIDYNNNNQEEEILYAYTFEYIKSNTNSDNISEEIDDVNEKITFKDRIKKMTKKVVRLKQDFDIKETYEKIKDFRDDILLTVQ